MPVLTYSFEWIMTSKYTSILPTVSRLCLLYDATECIVQNNTDAAMSRYGAFTAMLSMKERNLNHCITYSHAKE